MRTALMIVSILLTTLACSETPPEEYLEEFRGRWSATEPDSRRSLARELAQRGWMLEGWTREQVEDLLGRPDRSYHQMKYWLSDRTNSVSPSLVILLDDTLHATRHQHYKKLSLFRETSETGAGDREPRSASSRRSEAFDPDAWQRASPESREEIVRAMPRKLWVGKPRADIVSLLGEPAPGEEWAQLIYEVQKWSVFDSNPDLLIVEVEDRSRGARVLGVRARLRPSR